MGRPVKHVQLHRIGPTELRVISDVDAGVLGVVQQEEAVLRGYMRRPGWPHRQVSLFVLRNLEPLARQISGGALPQGGAAALGARTVVNLFDLADPRACHVYVNYEAMLKEGYWDDPLAIRGLLAHEHAHPLAENATTRASRALALSLDLGPEPGAPTAAAQQARLAALLAGMTEELCLYAPRELFTNELAIGAGFGEALLHLNLRNVANACQSVAGREKLRGLLLHEAAHGSRPHHEVGQLLLAGDLESYLRLAMEVVPFARAGRPADAGALEELLERELFPHLEPQVQPAYAAIRQLYAALSGDLAPESLAAWAQQVADVIVAALRGQGVPARCRVGLA